MTLHRRCAAIALLATAVGGRAPAQEQRLETSDLYRRVASQVVEIRVVENKSASKSQVGSGFFVSASGDIVTNYHVIAPLINDPADNHVEWIEANGTSHPLRVLAVDAVHDLAIVASDQPVAQFFPLSTAPIAQGTRVYALGHPNDLGLSIVEGTYNGLLQYTLYPRIHFTGAINPGMSGGPAITTDGRAIGVNVATSGNSIGFLVPIDRAAALLARVSAPGYAPPKEFLTEIGAQIRSYQDAYFSALLADPTPTVTLGAFTVPTQPAPFFKCWGDAGKDENDRRYDWVTHSCATDDHVFLSEEQKTGFASLYYTLYTTAELNRMRFFALLSKRYKTFASEMEGSELDVTNFECRTRNVRHGTGERGEVVMRVATCIRKYKKLPGLYDVVTHVAVLGHNDSGLLVRLTLSGVSYENAERLTLRLLESIK